MYLTEIVNKNILPWQLLLLADPSVKLIKDYIYSARCFVMKEDDQVLGQFVVAHIDPEMLEIKNLSVKYSGKGLGSKIMNFLINFAINERFCAIVVSTGNSSVSALKLYKKFGFQETHCELNYFIRTYDEPIYENGIQCKDRLTLRLDLDKHRKFCV